MAPRSRGSSNKAEGGVAEGNISSGPRFTREITRL